MNLYEKINNSKLVNKKNIKVLTLIIVIACLIPLIIISFYNFPSADDFNYLGLTHQIYLKEGILGFFKGAITTATSSYMTWQGTYSASLFAALNPFAIDEKYYILTSFVLIGTFLFSLWNLLKYIFYDKLKLDKNSFVILGCILSFLCIQFVPSLVEAFYWWDGAAGYTFFYSVQLLFICGILKQFDKPNNGRLIKLIFYSLFISGGNFVTNLNNLIILVLLLVYLMYKKNNNYKFILVLLITSLTGFLINILAPGNAMRAVTTQKMNPILAIITSFFAATKKIDTWTNLIIVLCLFLCLYLIYPTLNNIKFKFKNPLIVTFISFCIFSALFTPSLYAMSNIGPLRLQNIIYYDLILYLFIIMYYWLGYIKQTFINKELETKINLVIRKHKATLFVCFIAILGMNLISNYSSLSTYKAFIPLYNGEAKVYKEQMEQRIKLYHDSSIKKVEVEELLYKPEAIFFDDIEDIDNWKNQSLANYYNKESVSFKEVGE